MNRLCDEILQIILNELDDPTNFSLMNKSIHALTREPYVRATYFIVRYGKVQAMYWALGRGKLVNKTVIDILLSSGAHISRYLIQCIIQHYYRSLLPWIKTPWVRSLDFTVLNHLVAVAGDMYGNIPVGKNEDDGAKFVSLLKESRIPVEQRTVKWEVIKEIVEKYHFIPFSNKDPMMASFPLVLAIEPRLLPYARANGFYMDRKYRDFVFRKMFEKPVLASDSRCHEIAGNVRELSRLDRHMFLSRTVAGEICMEAKSNEAAYEALKILNKEGLLRFSLSSVVEELIKLFINTRSITLPSVVLTLRHLFTDFPSKDPMVRVVLLLQIFINTLGGQSSLNVPAFVPACKEKIESLGLAPVKRTDLLEVLANNFAPEHFGGILEFGRSEMKMSRNEIEGLVQELATRCLESSFKGKMLKRLLEGYPFLDDLIRQRAMQQYRLKLEDLPAWDDEKAIISYQAPLCREFCIRQFGGEAVRLVGEQDRKDGKDGDEMDEDTETDAVNDEDDDDDLGNVGQDTLSTMIRKDEMGPPRARRRFYDVFPSVMEHTAKLTYPSDYLHVGRLIRTRFGVRSGIAAVFMMNAVANGNPAVIQNYSSYSEAYPCESRIPLTLKLFKMLARLGRSTGSILFEDIEAGAEFYFSEEDYLTPEELNGTPQKSFHSKRTKRPRYRIKMVQEYTVKTESSPGPSVMPYESQDKSPEAPTVRLRPRRSAAASMKSYVVPDSDDEAIADAQDEMVQHAHAHAKKRKVESNMQKWIKHLTILMKEEEKKYKEKKKRMQAALSGDGKLRVARSEFLRSLAYYLQRLRKSDKTKRQQLYGLDVPDEDYSSGEEDEYQARTTRKRRKVEH